MSEDRRETIVWDNIPEWALYALEYGIDEDLSSLTKTGKW